MIIWKNFRLNLSFLIIDVIIFFIMIYDYIINYKIYTKEEKQIVKLCYFTITIFFIVCTVSVFLNHPCKIHTVPMEEECVACWDSSKISGVKCYYCNNTPLCEKCYLEWKTKGGTCPLCRAKYII